ADLRELAAQPRRAGLRRRAADRRVDWPADGRRDTGIPAPVPRERLRHRQGVLLRRVGAAPRLSRPRHLQAPVPGARTARLGVARHRTVHVLRRAPRARSSVVPERLRAAERDLAALRLHRTSGIADTVRLERHRRERANRQDHALLDQSAGLARGRAMSGPFRIASAQYPSEFLGDWATYETKIARWVGEAASNGARLLVFPEYFSMELASLFPPEIHGSLPDQLAALQELLPKFLALFGAQ